MKKISKFTILIFIIVTLGIFFVRYLTSFFIDIKWFKEVSYLPVFFIKVSSIFKLLIPSFIIISISIWAYFNGIRKNINVLKGAKATRRCMIVNLIGSFILSIMFSCKYWYYILQFLNSVPFNDLDPIYKKDISFYIFKLPFIESMYTSIMGLLIFLVIITFIVYFILEAKDRFKYNKDGKMNLNDIRSGIKKFAGRQLAIICALLLVTLSLGFLIKCWNLVYSPRGLVYGASYTDIKITLLFYRMICLLCIVSSIVVFISILKRKAKPILICLISILFLISLEGITSTAFQNFLVKSNEKKLEEPYVNKNIECTRKAFNINNVKEINFKVNNNLTKRDIEDNKDTISNIRINSFEPALEFFNQYQTIRPYYIFNDIDIDTYKIDGKENQVFVSARELNLKSIEPDTWQNRHLIYTHGYGVAMSKVNSVTNEGQPDFVIKDIPIINDTEIGLNNARIYFGEKTDDYAIVNTSLKEFDYPQDGDNHINNYNGKAGINMSFFNKAIFAINKRDLNFLLSRDISKESKILINRNIVKRANKIAPFLKYDNDPYVVINNDKLYWVLDAYTISDRFPYSQKYDNINYIRNSIKVIIDAYDGDIKFYIVDKNDPLAMSYSKMFPNLFRSFKEIPAGISEHFKYPEDIFKIQCNVFQKYHMTDAIAFLNGDDLWEVSKDEKSVEADETVDEAPYVFMKLPKEKLEEMVLLEYFNMKSRNTMSAILGARMDYGKYGELIMYRLPSYKTIYSPYFFKQKLKQDPIISKELSLWNAGGTKVKFGDTIIVPINNSLLYVESVYLRANGKSSAPEVKRIILSYGDKVLIGENIISILDNLFNKDSVKDAIGSKNVKSIKCDMAKKAMNLYDDAIKYQKQGNWAGYGESIKKLGEILKLMIK